jgi:hypothetical protein
MPITINLSALTSYTLVIGDADEWFNATGANPTWTVPPNGSVPFPVGTYFMILFTGTGTFTLAGGAGVTLVPAAGGSLTCATGQELYGLQETVNTWRISRTPFAGDVFAPASAVDNAIARFNTATGKLLKSGPISFDDSGQINLPFDNTPTTPAAGNMGLLATRLAGSFDVPGFIGPDGFLRALAVDPGEFNIMRFQPSANGVSVQGDGSLPLTVTGTASAAAIGITNLLGMMRRVEALVTVASATAAAGMRATSNLVRIGRQAAAPGGFLARCTWAPATGVATATNRAFTGLIPTGGQADVEPSTQLNCVGMGWDAADANIQIMHNDGAGSCTKIDLGASFPVPTVDRTEVYELQLYSPDSLTQSVGWRVIRYNTTGKTIAAQASGTITTDMPGVTQLLSLRTGMSVGGTSSVIGVVVIGMHLATVY